MFRFPRWDSFWSKTLYSSVDAREHQFRTAERWSDENMFANRADFMPDRQPAELGVDNIRKDDAGIYRCRVDFKVSQTRNTKVNLTVIGKCDQVYCTVNIFILINWLHASVSLFRSRVRSVEWILLAQDRIQWRESVNTVMDLRVFQK
jgi:hypothetical protein